MIFKSNTSNSDRKKITFQLRFKPFKSYAKSVQNQKVRWNLDSKLPIFHFSTLDIDLRSLKKLIIDISDVIFIESSKVKS